MSLDVTIVICTRDRAARLRRVLESVCALVIPDGTQWEIIVVDNGSSDDTGAVIRDFTQRLPLRPMFEPEPGVCWARNCAAKEARGRYICWTDDDVVLAPHWLQAYLEAFARHPEAALFGGPIEPLLEAPVRPLFERVKQQWPLAGPYACRSPGPEVRPLALEDCDVPYGANFAIRTTEQQQFPFDTRFGPSPGLNLLADELDVIYRVMQQGATGWWVPDAHVHHVIAAERQTFRYLITYYRRVGHTAVWLHRNMPGDNINEMNGPPVFTMPASITQLPRHFLKVLRVIRKRTGLRGDEWLGFLALYGYGLGLLRHWRIGRTRKPATRITTLQAESR